MTDNDHQQRASGQARRLLALSARIEMLADSLARIESRLEALHAESQRTAIAAQRVILRQESLAQGVGRIEDLLRGR